MGVVYEATQTATPIDVTPCQFFGAEERIRTSTHRSGLAPESKDRQITTTYKIAAYSLFAASFVSLGTGLYLNSKANSSYSEYKKLNSPSYYSSVSSTPGFNPNDYDKNKIGASISVWIN